MAASTPLISVDDVRAFIDEYFEAWRGTYEDRILSYYAENVSLEIPGMVMNGRWRFEISLSARLSPVFPETITS